MTRGPRFGKTRERRLDREFEKMQSLNRQVDAAFNWCYWDKLKGEVHIYEGCCLKQPIGPYSEGQWISKVLLNTVKGEVELFSRDRVSLGIYKL